MMHFNNDESEIHLSIFSLEQNSALFTELFTEDGNDMCRHSHACLIRDMNISYATVINFTRIFRHDTVISWILYAQKTKEKL